MKSSVLRFVFAAVFAIGLSLQAVAQAAAPAALTKPGAIKVGKVQGEVKRLTADGKGAVLKAGDSVIETDSIKTENGAMVVLVFANGASIKLGSNTLMKIEEFKMDPLDQPIEVAKLQNEPTTSKTSLNLAYGEMVGDVKHLNKDKGSSFNISTPVGAAGIRGTQFRIVFTPTGDGRTFTLQLQTADGHVVFTREGQTASPELSVLTSNEIVVTAEATVDPTTGTITVTNVQVPEAPATMSEQATTAITETVKTTIVEAAQTTTITITEQKQASTTPTNTGGTGSGGTTGSGTTGNGGTTTEPKDNTTEKTGGTTDPVPGASQGSNKLTNGAGG